MRIRGCSTPSCNLCAHAVCKDESGMLFCEELKKETEKTDSCSEFRYDIFKYQPCRKNDFSKFSKEDFEI